AVAATTAYLRGNPPVSGILALSGAIAIGWAGAVALASFESPTALGWGLLGIGCGLASAWSFGVRRKFAGGFMGTGENGSCVQRLVSAGRATLGHRAFAASNGAPSVYWRVGIFTAIVILSAILDSYRLLDVPGELDPFGTQAMVGAKRLIHGELS